MKHIQYKHRLYQEQYAIIIKTGEYIGNYTELIVTNKPSTTTIPHSGKLQIVKLADSEELESSGETFSVTVTVTYADGTTEDYPLTLDINEADSDYDYQAIEVSWTGDTAPTYTITENLSEDQIESGIELVSITDNGSGSFVEDSVITVKVINDYEIEQKKYGRIQIEKTYLIDGNEIEGIDFWFEIVVTFEDGTTQTKTVKVTSGERYRSGYYYWMSDEEAPTYTITEVNLADGVSSSISPSSGSLDAEGTIDSTSTASEEDDDSTSEENITYVTAENDAGGDNRGTITLTKIAETDDKIALNDVSGTFAFDVDVTGTVVYYGEEETKIKEDGTLSIRVYLTAGSSWTSGEFVWEGDDPPTYTVTEVSLPTDWYLVGFSDNASGVLEGDVSIVCTNSYHYIEKVELTMQIGGKVWNDTDYSDSKEGDETTGENGLLDEGEEGIANVKVTVYRVLVNVSSGEIINTFDTVYVYDENDKETLIDTNYTYTDSDGNWSFKAIAVPGLMTEEERDAWGSYTESGEYMVAYDIEFSYDGQTYEPTSYLVTSSGDASAYKNASTGTAIASDGSVLSEGSSGSRDDWAYDSMAIDDSGKREEFNAKFEEIKGDTPIDVNGKTVGTTSGGVTLNYTSTDSVSLFSSDNTRKVSTLDVYDDDGLIEEDYIMTAKTSTVGLTYPFDTQFALESFDVGSEDLSLYRTIFDENAPDETTEVCTYYFTATYSYMQNINLGLIEREYADVSIEKDLTEAIVVINGKVLKYKYNSSIDLEDATYEEKQELLYKQIAVADAEIEYTLGLYASDYYYRASIYDDSEGGQALGSYISSLSVSDGLESTEMEVYLVYTIVVHNESETYDIEFNEIADYYDSTFTLIDSSNYEEESKRYVQTVQDEEVNDALVLADPSTYVRKDSEGNEIGSGDISWETSEEGIVGSDEVTYNKVVTTSLDGTKLAAGETFEITMSFKVNKEETDDDGDGVVDSIIRGEKHNVVEITNFSAYYSSTSTSQWASEGDIAGRVDKDSAPDNVNIEEFNETSWYEDDTDSAPILTIELYDVDREINGLVWEDAQTNTVQYNQTIGNGLYNPDEGDTTIAGVTTEIVETILVPDSSGTGATYTEYDFIWPETIQIGSTTYEDLTGFKSTTTTDDDGNYSFVGVPAGNYKIRFVYGDTYIETGNTEDEGEVVYNGQDYKSTSYQVGFAQSTEDADSSESTGAESAETTETTLDSTSEDEVIVNDSNSDGYIDNTWHDLTNDELNTTRVSDARDSEARRLYITAKSEILTWENTSILQLADEFLAEKDADGNVTDASAYDDLFGTYDNTNPIEDDEDTGYYMYAETAWLKLEIEDIYDISYELETVASESSEIMAVEGDATKGYVTSIKEFTYTIDNIDFGIEERSQTKLTLDKQIKEITLTTSDGEVILDAVYDIEYELKYDSTALDEKLVDDDDKTIIGVSVTLNKWESTGYNQIASLNRNSGTQGYRYIMAEGTILQGATIDITYQLAVFNVGEADTCNQVLKDLWDSTDDPMDAAKSVLSSLTSNTYTVEDGLINGSDKFYYGEYFGIIYYSGADTSMDTDTLYQDVVLVESEVHSIIDYVDPDVEFIDTDNAAENQAWATTTIGYLFNYGLITPEAIIELDSDGNPVISGDAVSYYSGNSFDDETDGENYAFVSDEVQIYSDVVLNIDDEDYNSEMVKAMVPYSSIYDLDVSEISTALGSSYRSSGSSSSSSDEEEQAVIDDFTIGTIELQVSRYYSSEEDANEVDNVAEIIKVTNSVGRRDIRTVSGNMVTYQIDWDAAEGFDTDDIITTTVSIYDIAGEEYDSSATEIITLTPPTGTNELVDLIMRILAISGCVGVILAFGIVLIKKKVIKKL